MSVNFNIDIDGNKIYDETISPIVKPTADCIAIIPKFIKALLYPIEEWNLKRDYRLKETERYLENKLKNVPEEKLVYPEAYIAVPALQAVAYSIDNEKIRNMYISLLANAMHVEHKKDVHPAFVGIISQLTPEDAILFKFISENEHVAICKARYQRKTIHADTLEKFKKLGMSEENMEGIRFVGIESSGMDIEKNFINISVETLSKEQVDLSFDNLIRLGMVVTKYGTVLNQREYEPFRNLREINRIVNLYPDSNDMETVVVMGTCELTSMGKQFAKICLDEI